MISIDLLGTEFSYWNGIVPIQTLSACRFYNVSFFSMSGLNRMLMAFMSVERHFLVFRPQLYRIRRSRYIIHYLPIIIIILWSFIYSIVTDVFLTCPEINLRYTRVFCGYTCSLLSPNTTMIYVWIQVFFPTMITTIACILLPVRFLMKKRNLQRLQWRRARKMILQLSIIATTYTLCWLPYTIILQLITVGHISLVNYYVSRFIMFIPYVPSLLTPFICFHTISGQLKFDVIKRIIRYCFPRHQWNVHPQNTLITQNQNFILNPTKIFIKKPSSIQAQNNIHSNK
jgi:hypothetical protein